jgi:hypothetical protein
MEESLHVLLFSYNFSHDLRREKATDNRQITNEMIPSKEEIINTIPVISSTNNSNYNIKGKGEREEPRHF